MFSICVIYSKSRRQQAQYVYTYLSKLPYYRSFDKIAICDGEPDYVPDDFTPIIVPRSTYFCRAKWWSCGIEAAKKNIVIILDCDRLPHPTFFNRAALLPPLTFLYCEKLYQLIEKVSFPTVINLLMNPQPPPPKLAVPDFRVLINDGTIQPGKNPMSGCVAFWKETYQKTGGLDPHFQGWGFNDTDYYMTAYAAGCHFLGLDLKEFHLQHPYEVPKRVLLGMNAYNGVHFYDKWRLPLHEVIINILQELGLTQEIARPTTLDQFLQLIK
jgi:hypothetical protein